ncbi:hypothetical protein B0H11DRAFT_873222 [Mycena galericulata]|nr:hypothetical protein B0H11DRAFT_873222 [Mycena galericulata]
MEDIRRPMRRRRMSAPPPRPLPARLPPCRPLPLSLEALDLSPASPAQALASLRFLVLSYLADLERRLSLFESAEWAEAALDMLHGIRADVRSHLPDLGAHLPDMDLKSHLPDMDFIAHLPDMDLKSLMQRWAELDFSRPLSYVPTLSARLSTLRAELAARRPSFEFDFDFDFPTPSFDFDYHSYFARPSFPFSPPARLASFLTELDAFLAELPRLPSLALSLPDLPSLSPCSALPSPFPSPEHNEEEAVARALQLSAHGARLITYADLPPAWQNNAFVRKGYRFVPLRRWYALVGSVFRLHNETLNIHTHLIPLVLWGAALAGAVWPTPLVLLHRLLSTPALAAFAPFASAAGALLGWLPSPPERLTRDAARYTPFSPPSSPYSPTPPPDGTETLFTLFALACLASSALWHTMAGCAGRRAMEACARVDYVGIGLIATSIATVVHHGYACAEAAAEATPLGHAVLHPSTLLQSGGVLEAAGGLLQHTSELLHVHSHSHSGGGEVAGGSSASANDQDPPRPAHNRAPLPARNRRVPPPRQCVSPLVFGVRRLGERAPVLRVV